MFAATRLTAFRLRSPGSRGRSNIISRTFSSCVATSISRCSQAARNAIRILSERRLEYRGTATGCCSGVSAVRFGRARSRVVRPRKEVSALYPSVRSVHARFAPSILDDLYQINFFRPQRIVAGHPEPTNPPARSMPASGCAASGRLIMIRLLCGICSASPWTNEESSIMPTVGVGLLRVRQE